MALEVISYLVLPACLVCKLSCVPVTERMFLSSQWLICWNSNLQCDGIGSGSLGRWLGHGSGALMNEIRVLIKEAPESSPDPYPSHEDIAWRQKTACSYQTLNLLTSWFLTFLFPELWKANVVQAMVYSIFVTAAQWTKTVLMGRLSLNRR